MTIKEIDDQIAKLQIKKKEIEKNELNSYLEKSKENIGRCFNFDNYTYAIIIDTPQKKCDKNFHTHYYKYWYPAIFLYINQPIHRYMNLETSPVYIDEVFIDKTAIYTHDHDSYIEITKDEFLNIMKNHLDNFCNNVIKITSTQQEGNNNENN